MLVRKILEYGCLFMVYFITIYLVNIMTENYENTFERYAIIGLSSACVAILYNWTLTRTKNRN
jgi:hypothetical protein